MPASIMQKNYMHCPLKKRPVFIVKEEFESDMEPENLSTKPEDLRLREKSLKTEDNLFIAKSEALSPQPAQYAIKKCSPMLPMIKSDKSEDIISTDEPLNFSSSTSAWHRPSVFQSPNTYSAYIAFPGFQYPSPNEVYGRHYTHISSARESSLSPPTFQHNRSNRDSSVSPPASVFIQPYEHRRNNNNVIKSETYSHHRYMPYQLNHHHHNLLPVDQSSLSPTSSHASYNSFVSSSNASMRSISPPTTPLEDLPTNYSISVLMEKSTSNSNIIQKSSSSSSMQQQKSNGEKCEKSVVPPRYQCPDCGKSYSTYSGLSKHQQFHCAANESNQVQKTVTCNECGKVYASTGALKMHIRTHTLPCKCHLCGKAFSRPWLLQGHIRTHTGEKPFSCNHCHRAFADRSNLRAHLQTHSDIKKYSCSTCSKTFSRMSLLTKHNDSGCPGIQIQQLPENFSNQIVPGGANIQVY